MKYTHLSFLFKQQPLLSCMGLSQRLIVLVGVLIHLSFMSNVYAQSCIPEVSFPGGRIALSADGNFHDKDDFGATPLALAMMQAAGLKAKLVHLDYNNNLCANNSAWEATMKEAALGSAQRFGFDASRMFNDQNASELSAGTANLAKEINASSAGNLLWIVAGGPMETVYRGIAAAQVDKLKFVRVISHSDWNEKRDKNHPDYNGSNCGLHHNWDDMVDDFQGDGVIFYDHVFIGDQNNSNGDNDFNGPFAKWEWLKNASNPNWAWIYNLNDKSTFDVSDAGMTYWLLTGGPNGGNKKGGWAEAKKLLENPCSSGGGTTDTEAPTLPGILSASDITASAVKLSWGASTDNQGVVAYEVYQNDTQVASVATTTTAISGLTCATSYVFKVRARDAAGNVSAFTSPVSVTTAACATGGTTPVYCEVNGVVMFEAENTTSALDKWIKKTDNPGFTGSGHIEFTGNTPSGGPATSPLKYTFKITQSGEYRLFIRSRKRLDGQLFDKSNDGYVRVEGDYTASATASNVHNGNAMLDLLKKNTKFFGGPATGWGWAMQLDAGGEDNKRNAVYTFKAGETYTLVLSGRSINWNVDRIVFRLASVPDATAFGVTTETKCSGGGGCANTVTIPALTGFPVLKVDGFAPAYLDNARQAIAVNPIEHGSQWAAAQTTFSGSTGTYDVVLKTLTEIDGESSYRVRINNKLLEPVFKNPETTQDYVPASYTWKGVSVKTGDQVQVEFQAHTNGKIPEGNGTAFSRGRWTELALTCGSSGGGGGGDTTSTPTDITDLAAVAVTCKSIRLTWSDVKGETAYRIRRKVDGDAVFVTLKDVLANVTSYVDEAVNEKTTYVYQVRPLVDAVAVKTSNFPVVQTPACSNSGCLMSGGRLTTSSGDTTVTICSGDGISEIVDISITGNTGKNCAWALTDTQGTILTVFATAPFDLEEGNPGSYLLTHISFDEAPTGIESGKKLTQLVGCFGLSNPIYVTRKAVRTWYADTDGDGKGDETAIVRSCEKPSGYVDIAGDLCPMDALKTSPGSCGCGIPEGSGCTDSVIDAHIHPNPFVDEIRVTFNTGVQVKEARLFDSKGMSYSVVVKMLGLNQIIIYTSSVPSGMYTLKVFTDKGVMVKNVMKIG